MPAILDFYRSESIPTTTHTELLGEFSIPPEVLSEVEGTRNGDGGEAGREVARRLQVAQIVLRDHVREGRKDHSKLVEEIAEVRPGTRVDLAEFLDIRQLYRVEARQGETLLWSPGGTLRRPGELVHVLHQFRQLGRQRPRIRVVRNEQVQNRLGPEGPHVPSAIGHGTVRDFQHRLEDRPLVGARVDERAPKQADHVDRPFQPATHVEEPPAFTTGHALDGEPAERREGNHGAVEEVEDTSAGAARDVTPPRSAPAAIGASPAQRPSGPPRIAQTSPAKPEPAPTPEQPGPDEEAEACVAQFEQDAQHARSLQDLEECAGIVTPMEEADRLSRSQRERIETAMEAARQRIAAPTDNGQAAEVEEPEAEIDPANPDYQRGIADRKAGQKKCVISAIRETPERMAAWKAGYDSLEGEA